MSPPPRWRPSPGSSPWASRSPWGRPWGQPWCPPAVSGCPGSGASPGQESFNKDRALVGPFSGHCQLSRSPVYSSTNNNIVTSGIHLDSTLSKLVGLVRAKHTRNMSWNIRTSIISSICLFLYIWCFLTTRKNAPSFQNTTVKSRNFYCLNE